MTRIGMKAEASLSVSLARNGQALLAVQLTQEVGLAIGRRELRALRSEAMAALALAWCSQTHRDRWRHQKP